MKLKLFIAVLLPSIAFLAHASPSPAQTMDDAIKASEAYQYDEARSLLETLHAQGNVRATYYMGWLKLSNNVIFDRDPVEAKKLLISAAEAGDAFAQLQLAKMYYFVGRTGGKNDYQAAFWYEKAVANTAALQEDVHFRFGDAIPFSTMMKDFYPKFLNRSINTRHSYFNGQMVVFTTEDYWRMHEAALKHGDVDAALILGKFIDDQVNNGFYWLSICASIGNQKCLAEVGYLYEHGNRSWGGSIEPSSEIAAKYYVLAPDIEWAQERLSHMQKVASDRQKDFEAIVRMGKFLIERMAATKLPSQTSAGPPLPFSDLDVTLAWLE